MIAMMKTLKTFVWISSKNSASDLEAYKPVSRPPYVRSQASLELSRLSLSHTLSWFSNALSWLAMHQLSRLPCTVLCCTVYRHCLGIPMPYHSFYPCTVTAFLVLPWLSQSAVIWLSQSAGMSFPCTCKSFPCIVLRQ